MNQELTTSTRKVLGPPRPDPELSASTRNLVCWMPSDPTSPAQLMRALSDAERSRIETRVEKLEAALELRDYRGVERSVAGLMLSIPSGRASGEEARAIVAAYVNVLSDAPPWAVNEAANRFARGLVASANPAFPPSGAEVHQEVERVLTPYRAELLRLQQMLNGVVVERELPKRSREQTKAIEAEAQRVIAERALKARAVELGEANAAALVDGLEKQKDAVPGFTKIGDAVESGSFDKVRR